MRRRHFIVLSALSGLGMTILGKLVDQAIGSEPTIYRREPTSFPQTPETPPLFRFAALADTGTGQEGQYAVAQAMNYYYQQHPFKFVILAGDNIYNYGEIEKIDQAFERPYKFLLAQGVKFYACLGNHDIATQNGIRQIEYPGFNMGGRYYSFRQDPIQFWALDTNWKDHWQDQLPWLEQELSQSHAPWKIVFGHHPIYSSGRHGSNEKLIEKLTPLFEKYGVQLYINGHEHSYERTQSIQGTTYLICGAGAMLRSVSHSSWTETSASVLSFAIIDVYPDHLRIQGIDTNAQVFDQGVISRSTSM